MPFIQHRHILLTVGFFSLLVLRFFSLSLHHTAIRIWRSNLSARAISFLHMCRWILFPHCHYTCSDIQPTDLHTHSLISFERPTHQFTKYSACFFSKPITFDLWFVRCFFSWYFNRISFTWLLFFSRCLSYFDCTFTRLQPFDCTLPIDYMYKQLTHLFTDAFQNVLCLFHWISHMKLFMDNWLITCYGHFQWETTKNWMIKTH